MPDEIRAASVFSQAEYAEEPEIRAASSLAQAEYTKAPEARTASTLAQTEYTNVPKVGLTSALAQAEYARSAEARASSIMVQVEYAPSPLVVDCEMLIRISRRINIEIDTRFTIKRLREMLFDTLLAITVQEEQPARHASSQVDRALEFLGKGLKFPFTFQKRSGGAQISTATSSDHAHIHESIRQILGTRKGERFMRPEFGTRLNELVFEPNEDLLFGLIRHEVKEALEEWEPRIIVRDVEISTDQSNEHLVLVNIRYRLISSQVEGNMVYPFYRESE